MKIVQRTFIGLALIGTVQTSNVLADPVGTILGPQFNYHLIGAPLVAGGGFSVPNPGVDVSLNPQPLPPFPDPGASLSLINPSDPLYTYPGPGTGQENFLIGWGMNAGGAVSFTPPVPTPGDPTQVTFSAINANQVAYDITMTIGGMNPGSFVELNPQPLPPFPDPNVFSYAWFGFSAGDPTLSFTVTSGETTFAFSNVPEPTALTLLGAALAGIGFATRRKLS